jgi:hypothetical protein
MNAGKTLLVLAIAISSSATAAEIWNHSLPANGQLIWSGFSDGSTSVNVAKTNAPTVSYAGSGGQFSGYFYTDGTANADEFFRFFCIDLFQSATYGPASYTESPLTNDALARLYDIAYPNKSALDFYNGGSTNFGVFSSNVLSSAFQLAVWEIFYESSGPYSLTGINPGTFKSNKGANASGTDAEKAVNQANAWLAQINAGDGFASGWTLYKFVSDNQQDYVSAIYTPGGRTLPEPGSVSLLGLGLGAFALARRRRAR